MTDLPRVFVTESTVYVQWPGSLPRVWTKLTRSAPYVMISDKTPVLRIVQRPALEAVEMTPVPTDNEPSPEAAECPTRQPARTARTGDGRSDRGAGPATP